MQVTNKLSEQSPSSRFGFSYDLLLLCEASAVQMKNLFWKK